MAWKYNPFTDALDKVGSGGGTSYIDGDVEYHSNLPVTVGAPAVNSAFLVRKGEGLYFISRKPAGIWVRELNNGNLDDWKYAGTFSDLYRDANFRIISDSDVTKEIAFSAASITTGTTRTISVPNKNVTLDDAGDSRTPTAHSHTLASEISTALAEDPDLCRDALGLGDMATSPSSQFATALHYHAASDVTSGTLIHERGGLEADVSAYSGLVKISGGATSAVTVTTAGEALLDDADAAAQRTTLGLGTAATAASADFVAVSTIDAKGDLLVGTAADTVARLAVGGTNGHVLTVDSAEASGMKWAAASGGGSGGTKTYAVFTATDNNPPATDFATIDQRNSVACLDFSDTATESAVFVGVMPEGAVLTSGLIVRLHWMGTATTGNVRWSVAFERGNTDLDTDSFDTATAATATTNGTSGIVTVTAITCTNIDNIAAGDLFRLRVQRLGADAADSMTGAKGCELVAVEIRSAA